MTILPKSLTPVLILSIATRLCVQLAAEVPDPAALNPVIDPVLQHDWPAIDETSYNKYWALRAMMPDLGESIPQASDFGTIYFIDPTAEVAGTGLSPESPYNSWSQVSFHENAAYLQKCGTVAIREQRLVTSSNVLIGAYGEGPRPVLVATESVPYDRATIEAGADNVTIRDLTIKAPNMAACIKLGNTHMTIFNNVLQDAIWGIRGYGSDYRIYGNIIHNHRDDGMFLMSAKDLDIGWNFVFNINTDWSPPNTSDDIASGDSIQLEGCTNWKVHHNVLDRSTSGNKFALISNDGIGTCVVEYNYMAGPLTTTIGGAAVFFGGSQVDVDVRYNHIDRSITGIYTHAPMRFHGNIISNSGSAIYSSTVSNVIQNNVIYNIDKYLIRNGGTVTNNILDNRNGNLNLVQNTTLLQNNLFMGTKKGDDTNFSADPLFIDPENGNFRLSPDSPAIDAGTDDSLNMDRDGVAIPQGAHPDIGAFEFFGDASIPWTRIYFSWPGGWKLSPHGYVNDSSFPWILRLPVSLSGSAADSYWFYVHEGSISDSGFFAYDNQLQVWLYVSIPFSPWAYAYSASPDWQIW